MKALSFRARIALLSALISGVVLLAFSALAWVLFYQQKIQAVDTEIRALGSRHPGWLANPAGLERLSASLDFIFGEAHQGEVIFKVLKPGGEVLYVSPEWPEDLTPIDYTLADVPNASARLESESVGRGAGRGFGPGRGAGGGPVVFTKSPRFITVRSAKTTWRLGIMGNDDLRLVVGLDYAPVQAELTRMRNVFLATIPFALVLVGGGGWLVAGRALRPIRAIAQTAERVTAQGLDQRVPQTEADPEIRRLIEVLNGMMNRLETSFKQATRFSADASHELKTPLAILQGELEHAIQNAPANSREQQVYGKLLEEVQQLKRITGNLLLLAQADSGQLKLALEELSISEELNAILEDASILAGEAQIQVQSEIQPGVCVRADPGLLRIAIMNLVRNALNYNEPGGRVTLHLEGGEPVTLTICNSGPGISEMDQPRIFERFYRSKPAQASATPGLGLGLSLAREILHAHRGTLILQESRPGLTCFQVQLPGCASSSEEDQKTAGL